MNPLLDPVVRNKIVFINGPQDTEGHADEDTVITYCGGNNEAEFKYVDAESGENDCQNDTETKERLKKRHRRLTDQFEAVTRQWCEEQGQREETIEKRQVLIKKLRLSQLDLDPYFRGLTAYHRDGTVPLENAGMASFDYVVNGSVTRQVMGKPSCRKSLERELCEIVDGSSVADAEAKTKKMLADGSWGQWRVNDNPSDIVKKAMASLEDVEGTNKLNVEKAEPAAPAAKEAMATNGDASETFSDAKEEQKGDNGSVAAAGAASSAPKQNMSSSPSAKRMSKSGSATTDYGKENTGSKGGLFGSLKAKIKSN